MKWLSTGLILSSVFAGATSAIAQEQEADRERRGEDRDGRRAPLVARFDEDGDGRLNEDEREQARTVIRQRRQNRDDRLELSERGSRPSAEFRRRGRPAGPGGEFRVPRHGDRPGMDRPRGPSAAMLLRRFDRDGDRELDVRELRRMVDRLARFRSGSAGPRREGARDGARDGAREGRRGPRPDAFRGRGQGRPGGPEGRWEGPSRRFDGERRARPDGPPWLRGDRSDRRDRDDDRREGSESPASDA